MRGVVAAEKERVAVAVVLEDRFETGCPNDSSAGDALPLTTIESTDDALRRALVEGGDGVAPPGRSPPVELMASARPRADAPGGGRDAYSLSVWFLDLLIDREDDRAVWWFDAGRPDRGGEVWVTDDRGGDCPEG